MRVCAKFQLSSSSRSAWKVSVVGWGGWGVHSHYVVKPNLVLRLGWGFDNRYNSTIGNFDSTPTYPVQTLCLVFNFWLWIKSVSLCFLNCPSWLKNFLYGSNIYVTCNVPPCVEIGLSCFRLILCIDITSMFSKSFSDHFLCLSHILQWTFLTANQVWHILGGAINVNFHFCSCILDSLPLPYVWIDTTFVVFLHSIWLSYGSSTSLWGHF